MVNLLKHVAAAFLVAAAVGCGGERPADCTSPISSRGPDPTMSGVTQPPKPHPTTHPDHQLLAMLPASMCGHQLTLSSGTASDVASGENVSYGFSPEELQQTATNAGADPDAITWAVAQGSFEEFGVFIRAIRAPGATSNLLQAWLPTVAPCPYGPVTPIRVGDRDVSLLESGCLDTRPDYAHVTGDVLFVLSVRPASDDPAHPGGWIIETIRLLP
jgi:hypothetical protein